MRTVADLADAELTELVSELADRYGLAPVPSRPRRRFVLAKTRYYVPYRDFVWEIDVYEGILRGVVIAEVELERLDIEVPLPEWIGPEVTGDPDYRKINMLAKRLNKP